MKLITHFQSVPSSRNLVSSSRPVVFGTVIWSVVVSVHVEDRYAVSIEYNWRLWLSTVSPIFMPALKVSPVDDLAGKHVLDGGAHEGASCPGLNVLET